MSLLLLKIEKKLQYKLTLANRLCFNNMLHFTRTETSHTTTQHHSLVLGHLPAAIDQCVVEMVSVTN